MGIETVVSCQLSESCRAGLARRWLRGCRPVQSCLAGQPSQLETMTSTEQSHRHCNKDENGLILPKKIVNPCIQSPFRRDLNREIRWNTDK